MKRAIWFFVFLFAISAHAAPKVGDRAVYTGTETDDGTGVVTSIKTTQELTDYDSIHKTFTLRTDKVRNNNEFSSDERVVFEEDLLSSEIGSQYVQNCGSMGGQPARISVTAGTFETCAIQDTAGGDGNLGSVPFAIVRYTMKFMGKTISAELSEFQNGF